MQVTCPGCHSRFLLPRGVDAGTRLRCSVCRTEFVYAAPSVKEAPRPDEHAKVPDERPLGFEAPAAAGGLPALQKPKKRGGGLLWLLLLALVAAGCAVAWHTVPEFRNRVFEWKETFMPSGKMQAPAARAEAPKPQLDMRDVTNVSIRNDEQGPILVVEGRIFNQGTAARRGVLVEAALVDASGTVLATRVQRAGIRLTPLQLKVMNSDEMRQALNDNTVSGEVLPGAQIPFMFVFSPVPDGVSDIMVKLTESEEAVPAPAPAAPARPSPNPAAAAQPEAQN